MRITAIALLIALSVCTASGQSGGHIGLYSDSPGFRDMVLIEALYVVNSVYVVHSWGPDATSSRFAVIHTWDAIDLGADYYFNSVVGDISTGATFTYDGCTTLPHLVARLDFIPTIPTAPCDAVFVVVPDPAAASGQIEVVDCSSNVLQATGGWLCVNTPECDTLAPEPPCELPVAAEASTWGAVKALYQ